jgi:hypothetical protein
MLAKRFRLTDRDGDWWCRLLKEIIAMQKERAKRKRARMLSVRSSDVFTYQ